MTVSQHNRYAPVIGHNIRFTAQCNIVFFLHLPIYHIFITAFVLHPTVSVFNYA